MGEQGSVRRVVVKRFKLPGDGAIASVLCDDLSGLELSHFAVRDKQPEPDFLFRFIPRVGGNIFRANLGCACNRTVHASFMRRRRYSHPLALIDRQGELVQVLRQFCFLEGLLACARMWLSDHGIGYQCRSLVLDERLAFARSFWMGVFAPPWTVGFLPHAPCTTANA